MRTLLIALLGVALAAGSAGADAKTKTKASKGVARPGMLVLYSEPNFNGETYEFEKARVQVPMEWNVRSIAVAPGETWELCEKARYKGTCATIDKSVGDASEAGVTGMIGSLRVAAKAAKPK